MRTIRRLSVLLAFLLAGLPTGVRAAPVEWPVASGGNGHFYEVVPATDIGWGPADAAARGMFHQGVQGHLATITSAAEDQFVATVRAAANALGEQMWIGGYQQLPCTPLPTCGWIWVNGEGAIAGTNGGANYANWGPGQPNNFANLGQNYLAAYGLPANSAWNDDNGRVTGIFGYVVEYDGAGVVNANSCKASAGGCNPSGVQRVFLPDSVELEPDDTLRQQLVESAPGRVSFRDPRVDSNGNCTLTADGFGGMANPRQSLDVFGDGSLVLPPFLCGSPEFAVVRSVATFEVLQDVVRTEQYPERIFARRFECAGTPVDADLQRRGVFGWQPDDRARVLEGRALELTYDCGSSRGATPGASWFVLNLHVDCGVPFGSNDAAVRQCFIDLTEEKFGALYVSLKQAKDALLSPDYDRLEKPFKYARKKFHYGEYAESLGYLQHFIEQVGMASFDAHCGVNHQGNLLARAENIGFTIDKKIDSP